MQHRLALAFAVAAVLAVAAAGASAAELVVERGEALTATSSGKVSFAAGEWTVACALTLGIGLERGPKPKVANTKVGSLNSVNWSECEGGELLSVLELSWELQYAAIEGTLPSGMQRFRQRLKRLRRRWRLFGLLECLYEGDLGLLWTTTLVRGTTETYTSSSLRFDESEVLTYVSGSEACPSTATLRGSFTLAAPPVIARR